MADIENTEKTGAFVLPEDSSLVRLKNASEELLESASDTENELEAYYSELVDENSEVSEDEVQAKIETLRSVSSNLTKASLISINLEDELRSRWHDVSKSKRKRIVSAAPSNTMIDYKEKKTAHFAQGTNFYKLALVFVIGSFVGVVIELLWCLVTNGYLESRSGLVYGPFNMLYGVGAVALTVTLYNLRNHSRWLSFFGGLIIGSVIEYVCSFGQELLLGSRSWDYSDMPFNVNGRICLLYSVFWGFLGVLWIKNLYPRLADMILKIPNKIGIIVTWVMIVFFIFDGAVTYVALARWSQRIDGVPASNSFWEFVDERFDDGRMRKIFANMEFGDGENEETADTTENTGETKAE
ncbi:MAG: hypothetical protein ACI4XJ_01085 [Eubacteriales bacterium]